MTTSVSNQTGASGGNNEFDFPLGIEGFNYSDLYEPQKLKLLADTFYAEVARYNPELHEALVQYIDARGENYEQKVESNILTDTAPYLSAFVARMFHIETQNDELGKSVAIQSPIWKYKFFVQRRAIKKFTAEAVQNLNAAEIEQAFKELRNTGFSDVLRFDDELAAAQITVDLLELEELLTKEQELTESSKKTLSALSATYDKLKDSTFGKLFSAYVLEIDGSGEILQVQATLKILEAYSAIRFFKKDRNWFSLKTPRSLDYQNLVHITRPSKELPEAMNFGERHLRRRDGFKLTDQRATQRESLFEVDYCLICHDRGKDSCSKGLHEKDGSAKRNPLGIKLEGCPLDEKISEMHVLKRQGDSIGALALVTIDNPMCAGTGHRICNDCMKACIFQKQEPVNIPQAETSVLTDVLNLPYGFEIYTLLTRWNPLNAKRPYALPYNGKNVLVVGLGPAGYTLSQYLLNEGFGVIGMDGLKIEPMSDEITGKNGYQVPHPVKNIEEIKSQLDQRVLSGFGGVSEYGITVRWDKNFLTMLQLMLTRRKRFRAYGGIRFGGTLTIEDAWELGFDHIAIATGAGRPTVVKMKNNLIRGIRKASDFLMALQLTGAFKKDTLSNLQVRLPAIVIGGGLTGVDTATEIFAYYPVQVEKVLENYETIVAEFGEKAVWSRFDPEEIEVVQRIRCARKGCQSGTGTRKGSE
jgi:NADPH-dependent glutamate synthase beta subunit-like oxidoreductase